MKDAYNRMTDELGVSEEKKSGREGCPRLRLILVS